MPLTGSSATNTEKFHAVSSDIIEAIQSFYPVHSTEMGIHSYDHRLADYSQKSVKDMIKKLKDFEVKLHKIHEASLSKDDQIDFRLVKSDLDMALLDLDKIRWYRKSPQLYVDEAVNGIYFLVLSQHAPESERLYPIVSRMGEVPGLFATAQKNLSKPPQIWIDMSKKSLETAIDFYQQVASELMNKYPDKADEILKTSTRAREAMNDFITYLSHVQPGEEGSFAIGKQNFDYMLSHEYFLPIDSDSLLALGEQLLADAQDAYTEYESYVEENFQNGQDSVFVPKTFTRQDVLDYYDWEIRQMKLFTTQAGIATIPEDIAPLEVVETPPYLRTMVTSIAYQPAGPFDQDQVGYFYVRPVPEDIDRAQLEARYRYVARRGFRGSVVHEGYPGHHLQMQIAARQDDPIRKWQMNTMLIEGWALYSEEQVYHDGLYGNEDPVKWLGVLGGIRFRAARIVADVKLSTGRFTYTECVDWMSKALGIDSESGREFITGEVLRYTTTPTIQMSYLMGKREIQMLREAAEERDGDGFSEQAFHDSILKQGSIPPILLWGILGLQRP